MKNTKKFNVVSPDIRKLGIPLLSLFGIVVCFFATYKIGLNKLSNQKSEIKKIEKNINVLKQKQETLVKVKETLSEDMKFFSSALPDSNPALSIIYQIKNRSIENGLIINNIKSGGESKLKKFSKVDLSFDMEGNLINIISFIKLTQSFSPIFTIEKLELNQFGSFYKASVATRGYWAPLPKKIPAVNQPLSDFTDEEIKIITKISNLIVPNFFYGVSQESVGKENPFE